MRQNNKRLYRKTVLSAPPGTDYKEKRHHGCYIISRRQPDCRRLRQPESGGPRKGAGVRIRAANARNGAPRNELDTAPAAKENEAGRSAGHGLRPDGRAPAVYAAGVSPWKEKAGEIIKTSFKEAAKRRLPLQEPSIPAGKGASHVPENRESKSYSRVGGSP